MADLLPYLIGGLANGALYSLLALGFVLVYRATSVVNFAIGEFLLVGAYLTYTFALLLPLPLALLAALPLAFLFGVLVERGFVRPLLGRNVVAVIMATIGLAAALDGGCSSSGARTSSTCREASPTSALKREGSTSPPGRSGTSSWPCPWGSASSGSSGKAATASWSGPSPSGRWPPWPWASPRPGSWPGSGGSPPSSPPWRGPSSPRRAGWGTTSSSSGSRSSPWPSWGA